MELFCLAVSTMIDHNRLPEKFVSTRILALEYLYFKYRYYDIPAIDELSRKKIFYL